MMVPLVEEVPTTGSSRPLCRVSGVDRMSDVGQIKNGHAKQGKVAVLCLRQAIIHADQGGMNPPVRVGQETGGHRALNHLVALRSFLDEHSPGKEEWIGRGVYQLLLAGRGLAADTSGHVFETAGLQFEVELAMIRQDEFVVPPSLQPYMPISLGVAGVPIVGNFIRGENVVLVFDPDVADERIDLAMLLLLFGFEAHRDTRGGAATTSAIG